MAESSSADTMSCTRSVRLRSDGDIAPQSLSRLADAALPFLFVGYLPVRLPITGLFCRKAFVPGNRGAGGSDLGVKSTTRTLSLRSMMQVFFETFIALS
jgi:hypothetical protein